MPKEPRDYQIAVHPLGQGCQLCMSITLCGKLPRLFDNSNGKAVPEAIETSSYINDCLTFLAKVAEAVAFATNFSALINQGGFRPRKKNSSSPKSSATVVVRDANATVVPFPPAMATWQRALGSTMGHNGDEFMLHLQRKRHRLRRVCLRGEGQCNPPRPKENRRLLVPLFIEVVSGSA